MARMSISSRKIDEIRAQNVGLKQDAQALQAEELANQRRGQDISALTDLAKTNAYRDVGMADAAKAAKPPSPQWGGPTTTPNSGGASAGLPAGVQQAGNTFSQIGTPPAPGSYAPNPGVSYGETKPALGMPSFGGSDPAEMMTAFADGGPVYGPPGLDQVPAELPDGSPARLDNGEYVLSKDYVLAKAAKALGKKATGISPEALHALGISLLDAEVAEFTGKQPGAKMAPPLPGQQGMVPGMARGGPISEYGGYPYVEELPPRTPNALRTLPPKALGNRQGELSRATQQAATSRIPPGAQDHAGNAARTNNTIGAARAAGAVPPEFMRTPPPTNQFPTTQTGPFRIPRPPLPMAAPMSPPLMPYQGSPAYDGSASYWRGMGAPPTNQMPVQFVNPQQSLGAPRQGGALVPYQPAPGGESWNPRGTAYVRTDGGVEMGNMSQRGLVPRASVPARYQAPPPIEGQFTEILPRGSRTGPTGFFVDARGERQANINGTQVTVPEDTFGMRAMAQQPITDPVTGFGNMLKGLGSAIRQGPMWSAIENGRQGRAPRQDGKQGPISMGQGYLRGGQSKVDAAKPAAQTKEASASAPPSQIEKYGLDPSLWSEGKSGNTQGYAARTKATLEADQRARGEAYGRLTGLQPNAMNKDDAGYIAGLTEGFKNYQPGTNYASQIMARNRQDRPQQAIPAQPDYRVAAWEMTRRFAEPNGIDPETAAQYIYPRLLESMAPQQPDAAMARLQFDQRRAGVEDQQWAAKMAQERALAQQQQMGGMYRNIFSIDEGIDEASGQPIRRQYIFMGFGEDGQPIYQPLPGMGAGGNMGNNPAHERLRAAGR